jgi:hypothetical protein
VRPRTRWGIAAAVALVAIGVVVVVLAQHSSMPAAVSPEQAQDAATKACSEAAAFEALVARNAPIDLVKKALGRAESASDTASRGDSKWVALSGGIKSLRIGLDANDARVARTGIDVVHTECRRLKQ